MANQNTARRGIYMPKELLDAFNKMGLDTGRKVNDLMVDALTQYVEGDSAVDKKVSKKLNKIVNDLIEDYLKENK